MANDVLVDALPYIDMGYEEPGVREAVLSMIEEETKRYKPTKNYLEYFPPLNLNEFETELMSKELERLSNRQPMEILNMKRYELPAPSAGKMTDVTAWNEAVENSMAQLEHQYVRICNLELMSKYGAAAWKAYNTVLVQMMQTANQRLQDLRKQIQEINWKRKNSQTLAGEKLKTLADKWVSLVSKNYEIERVCVEIENEILQLNQKISQKEQEIDEHEIVATETSENASS
ncbi:pre-mRNA-splicing factor SPF27-like protein [Dinothrombium tinctorium]|uniref:Pre-mRNA-splicing factor SPF27 n=1 Tax=Dinothrombium tinctorium TaxID=1965070 RepID=A0A3S3P7M1_9ACAR|nr:pre-mRNA-splicing factor SPF27-like protein [Dinothrombium tinctorium]RWS02835.1 pre-mRNA-splicing factor SPF27-like protein [Dinothrombium tinctorium]RWS02837.1 pre-mRNA-splicing factor SPF27-like protein [Dinothrombium tinctorium]